MTHLAARTDAFSHDAVTGYLAGDHVTPQVPWTAVEPTLVPSHVSAGDIDDPPGAEHRGDVPRDGPSEVSVRSRFPIRRRSSR